MNNLGRYSNWCCCAKGFKKAERQDERVNVANPNKIIPVNRIDEDVEITDIKIQEVAQNVQHK